MREIFILSFPQIPMYLYGEFGEKQSQNFPH